MKSLAITSNNCIQPISADTTQNQSRVISIAGDQHSAVFHYPLKIVAEFIKRDLYLKKKYGNLGSATVSCQIEYIDGKEYLAIWISSLIDPVYDIGNQSECADFKDESSDTETRLSRLNNFGQELRNQVRDIVENYNCISIHFHNDELDHVESSLDYRINFTDMTILSHLTHKFSD